MSLEEKRLELKKRLLKQKLSESAASPFGTWDVDYEKDDGSYTPLESAAMGAGQTATYGFQDELSGGLEAAMGAGEALFTGENAFGDEGRLSGISNLLQNYKRARDTQRQQQEESQATNPNAYFTGEMAGALGSAALPLGALGGAAKAAPGLVRASGAPIAALGGATKAAPGIARAAQIGATQGAALGAGSSKADLTEGDILGLGGDTLKAGAIGGLAGGLFSGVGAGVRSAPVQKALEGAKKEFRSVMTKAAEPFKKKAGKWAINMLKPGKRQRKLFDKKVFGSDITQGEQFGDDLVKRNLVRSSDNIDDIILRAESEKKTVLDDMLGFVAKHDEGLNTLDARVPGASAAFRPNKQEFLEEMEKRVLASMRDDPGNQKARKAIERWINTEVMPVLPDRPLTFEKMIRARKNLDKVINYQKVNADPVMDAFKKFRAEMDNYTMDKMDEVYQAMNMPEMNIYKSLKKDYSVLQRLEDLGLERKAQLDANRGFSLTDYIGGGATFPAAAAMGLSGGSAAMLGLGAAAGNRFARRRGSAVLSGVYSGVAKMLEKSPEKLGKYAGSLRKAAARGNNDLAATHYVLQQTDPEYRQKFEKE